MELLECLQSRRSVRKFKSDAVEDAVIRQIVEAAAYAPSWKNSQTTRYIVVTNEELKAKVVDEGLMKFEYNMKTLQRAPMMILVTTVTHRSGYERDGLPSTSKGSHWESFDAGIAVQTFCLAANDLGIGTVIMGVFDEDQVIDIVGVPEGQCISAIIAMGYPDETPSMPSRKSVDQLLRFER